MLRGTSIASALSVSVLAYIPTHLHVSKCHTVAADGLEQNELQSQPNTRRLQA